MNSKSTVQVYIRQSVRIVLEQGAHMEKMARRLNALEHHLVQILYLFWKYTISWNENKYMYMYCIMYRTDMYY